MKSHDNFINFVRELYKEPEGFIPLHKPCFLGKEKDYVLDCIDSTFVSSVGKYVDLFEEKLIEYTGVKRVVATTNGTSALHLALIYCDVELGDEVITQAATFVATANTIKYCGAEPIFIDSAEDNLGMCPEDLKCFLENNCEVKDEKCFNRNTGKFIKACIPMHVFGNAVDIEKIIEVCNQFKIKVVEDSAEAIGSFYKGKHLGTYGDVGVLSFNGNKTITCGGGGAVLINDDSGADFLKHISTTAKVPHKWEYNHDQIGYNYRLPNLNAALACAQLEFLPAAIENKRETFRLYKEFAAKFDYQLISEKEGCKSNYWLNAFLFKSLEERNNFLENTNSKGVMTRPLWKLLNKLPPFQNSQTTALKNAQSFEERVVNIPSSVRL